jgi:CSLREA domain-containing protein
MPVLDGADTDYHLLLDGFQFGSLKEKAANHEVIFRPRPDQGDPNGFGTSYYVNPFLGPNGAVEPSGQPSLGTIQSVVAGPNGIAASVSGNISRNADASTTFGTWQWTATFTYDPATQVVASTGGTLDITLDGSLTSIGKDLNLDRLASNLLTNVPLQGDGTGTTGDMRYARVEYATTPDLRNFSWMPPNQPAHFPSDASSHLAINVVGDINRVDTQALGGGFQIAVARKPSLSLSFDSANPDDKLSFGGTFDTTKAQDFSQDNVGAEALVLKSNTNNTHLTFNFSVQSTLPGFVVNSTADTSDANLSDDTCDVDLATAGNQCTLRAAIQQANSTPGTDPITFSIPGSGVQTISPTSALPPINDTVIIDGYSQPGSSPNTLAVGNNAKLLIELDGTKGSGSAFTVNAPNNTFKGLVINSFPGAPFDTGYAFRLISAGNRIQGCYLGINPAGDTAEPNRGGGISVQATSQPPNTPSGNNLIGGSTAAARNVIGGGLQDFAININGLDAAVFQGGIIGGDGNTVQGNYIGTNAAGSAILGKAGINIFTKNNIIGGTTPEARNVMFAFGGLGLNLSESNASGNIIQGNYIGINATGDAALGSTTAGITLLRAPNNTIGGTAPGAGNVISGNSYGINAAESDNLKIQGNLIGTNAAGTAAIGNNGGVAISGGNNLTIGGTTPGARNIISGSTTGHGIVITTSAATTGASVQGNYIGTDITGTLPLKNAGYGIQMLGQPPTAPFVIGGTTTAAHNVISGNALDGISLQTSNIFVQGNFIGTDANGTSGLGNGGNGIRILADGNAIGATTGAGNRLAFNSGAGVSVAIGANNPILGNSFFSNTGLGIDLGNTGVNANDVTPPADSDTGANNLQNFPVIASAIVTGTQLTVTYSVPSDVSNSQYPLRVEFYKADADAQEGQTFLGSVVYPAAQAGVAASPSFIPAVPLAAGDEIVATATDTAGNTSEFSAAATVQSCTTVINTDDSGLGSLRQAIICANAAPGADTITFNIPGNGVHTISPLSALPIITDPVIIDGYTQPGASPNTNGPAQGDNANLLIELNGSNAPSTRGLDFSEANGTVRGLVINNFTIGIFLNKDNNVVEGNFIGTNPAGTSGSGMLYGINVGGSSANNRIGGADADDGAADGKLMARNVISGCEAAINIAGSGNLVRGNLLGTQASGIAALGNGSGVFIGGGTDNLIGGTAFGAGNVISKNINGVFISGALAVNTVQGNLIGTDVTGTASLGNTNAGVFIYRSNNAMIGGTAPGAGNVIAYNSHNGISIQIEAALADTANSNAILGNSIYQNGDLGIDLNADGPTPNDHMPTMDADTGPNNLQNFPAFTGAAITGTQLSLNYSVPSDPANSQYPLRIEFFKTDAGGTQGQTFLGSDTYTADQAGDEATVTFTTAVPLAVGDKIVATATDNAGNTSEFSDSVTVQSCLTVVNTDDSGIGSLRQAITCANAAPGLDTITFNIPGPGVQTITLGSNSSAPITHTAQVNDFFFAPQNITINVGDSVLWSWVGSAPHSVTSDTGAFDSGIHTNGFLFNQTFDTAGVFSYHCAVHPFMTGTITVVAGSSATPLPTITDPVIIDGYSQPGAGPNTNAIDDLNPAQRGLNGTLLIQLSGPAGGAPAMAGLNITGNDSTVRGLVINGFANSGIRISGGNNNVIAGNYIGTDPTGESAAGNGKWGILLDGASAGNRVGTNGDGLADAAEENLIGASGFGGIGIVGAGSDNNVVAGNFIGIDALGTGAIGNANRGVDISGGAQHNRIGTNADGLHDAAERNIISQNAWAGIGIYNAGTSFNVAAGNWIGVDITGSAARPNGLGGVNIFDGATQNTIGGLALGAGNVIAFNSQFGINVVSPDTAKNSILRNSIFGNLGLGIDLGSTGFTPNDPIDTDAGPNNLQNFPAISYATRDAGNLKVIYNVPSDPNNSTYPIRVEFFLADANGQGKTYLGFDTFTDTDSTAGGKTVTFTTAAPIKVFDKIVATATDSLTTAADSLPANTSEFSPTTTIVSPWQNLNPGRLRWDVNDDSFVSADDVLGVINYINAKGSGLLPDDAKNEKPYVDVDGDNNVVAADVIDIINYINAGRRLGGEAEAQQDAVGSGQSSLASGKEHIVGDLLVLLAADVAAESVRKRRT